jgi:hypothetical protein
VTPFYKLSGLNLNIPFNTGECFALTDFWAICMCVAAGIPSQTIDNKNMDVDESKNSPKMFSAFLHEQMTHEVTWNRNLTLLL